MTGRIIQFHGDLHDETASLLPWYVTDRLDPDDRARVEVHLNGCAQCQAALATERRLQAAVAALDDEPCEAAEMALARLRPQLKVRTQRAFHLKPALARVGRQWQASAPWMRWAMAAQLTLLVVGGGLMTWQAQHAAPQAAYHALGAAPSETAGNIVVIFRPDIRESELRQVLRDSHARLVDGPTPADAYLLRVPAAARDRTVADLRNRPAVVLAEPVDAADAPGGTP